MDGRPQVPHLFRPRVQGDQAGLVLGHVRVVFGQQQRQGLRVAAGAAQQAGDLRAADGQVGAALVQSDPGNMRLRGLQVGDPAPQLGLFGVDEEDA